MVFAVFMVNLLFLTRLFKFMNHRIDIYKEIETYIAAGRINEALNLIDNSAASAGALAEIRSATSNLRESYGLMTDYALSGRPDLSRHELYAGICESIRSLADRLHRISRIDDAPTLYFNTLRFQLSSPDITIAALLGEYRRINQRLQTAMLAEDADRAGRELTVRAEDVEKRIFNLIWVTHPLSVDDVASVGNIFSDLSLPRHFKSLCVSALLMGELQYHDEQRLRLLMDAYESEDVQLSVRALCALLISMSMNRARPMSPRLRNRFEALTESDVWSQDVKMAMLQFIRSRDTERISRKMTDEVIPEMMKLRPELEKLGTQTLDPESIEENPEWAELLDKSGVADKLKELQELQEDGADVMMVTFSRLKTFPFFHDISNWFMPFHSSHSLVAGNADASQRLFGEMIASSAGLCSSDRFSIVLSLSQMPSAQRDMIASQLKANSDAIAAMSVGDLSTSAKDRELIARSYVQDLYRFFRLFRRKGEFVDPFATSLNLVTMPDLAAVFDDADSLRLVGEFYFSHTHYADAFDIFSGLSLKIPPSAELFQKMGYCCQMGGRLEDAIKYYEQSELLNAESEWTIRKLAACNRMLHRWKDSLSYYRRLEESHPDDASVAYNTGLCEMMLGNFDKAISQFYKVEFLRGESLRSSRPLFECYLATGNADKAEKYCDLVLSRDPSARDLLLAGIFDIRVGNLRRAVDRFAGSIAARNFDVDDFMRSFKSESRAFLGGKANEYGESAVMLPDSLTLSMIIDSAISLSSTLGQRI